MRHLIFFSILLASLTKAQAGGLIPVMFLPLPAVGGCTTQAPSAFTWMGGGGNTNWDNNANWHGGNAPGVNDTAIFDGNCTANCSPTINASINVGGIQLKCSYGGTVTQGASSTVTVGASGFTQAGGFYAGSSATMTTNGPFNLSAGVFTSTSGTFNISNNGVSASYLAVTGLATFNHNNGTVNIAPGYTGAIIYPGTVAYKNMIFTYTAIGYSSQINFNSGTANVDGNLTLAGCSGVSCTSSLVFNGALNLKGHLYVTGKGASRADANSFVIKLVGNTSQNIDFTGADAEGVMPSLEIASTAGNVSLLGDVRVTGHYTFTSGNLVAGTSNLIFSAGNNSIEIIPGTATYNNVFIEYTNTGYSIYKSLNNGTMTIGGNLVITGCAPRTGTCNNTINNGTFDVKGNMSISGEYGGDVVFQLTGANNTTLSSVAASSVPAGTFTINKSTNGATVTLQGDAYLNSVGHNLTITRGTLDMYGSDVYVNGTLTIGTNGTLICNSGIYTVGTFTNNGTLNCAKASHTFTSVGSIASNASKAASANSYTFSPSATISSGNLAVLVVAADNLGTTNGNTSEHTTMTDSLGNVWKKKYEYSNANGAAGAAATVSIWTGRIYTSLTTSDTITVNFSGNITAKAITGWQYSFSGAPGFYVAGSSTAATNNADAPSLSISGLTSTAYLWLRAGAIEDGATTYTASTAPSTYTTFTHTNSQTTGGGANPNMTARGEFRLFTGTGDTSNPTTTNSDQASAYIALQ